MAHTRFTWEAFDDVTVTELHRSATGSSAGVAEARGWLAEHARRPNDDFVRVHRVVLETHWLSKYPGLRAIARRLAADGFGPGGQPSTDSECLRYIRACRSSRGLRSRLLEAVLRFGDHDPQSRTDDEWVDDPGVPRFVRLAPRDQKGDPRKPHPYQSEAWEKLSAEAARASVTRIFCGLLVMPTGAGKTFTAARWLVQNVLDRGGRVLWIAHRHELLEQAAHEFHVLAGLLQSVPGPMRVRIVSGVHCSTVQIDPADHVVVSSIASLARNPEVVEQLLADDRRFVVIDEAHHAPAKSYRTIIQRLSKRRSWSLLGITATPTRTVDEERGVLGALFAHNVIYQVALRELVERRYLARPRLVRVRTGAEVERGVTQEDEAWLARMDELSEEWKDRIAHLNERNHLIVEHWFENRHRYGKTLVFAINIAHADLLTQHFNARLAGTGIEAAYIASSTPDGETLNNREIVSRFRSKDEALKVLVNVQMLTEGIDLPDVQTVLLARPTSSEILLRQMVGRALRGPLAGGTAEAWLVSFEDHWEKFTDWESPFDRLPDLVEAAVLQDEDGGTQPSPPAPVVLDALPWDLIRDVATRIRSLGITHLADAFDAVPDGSYVLERLTEGECVRQVIPVYAHQRPCWDAYLDHLWSASVPTSLTVSALFHEFFGDCDAPWPSEHDVMRVLEHARASGDRPTHVPFEVRRQCDPSDIAQIIHADDLRPTDRRTLIEARYNILARAIYPTLRDFEGAINDVLFELEHPEESTRVHRAIPIFEAAPTTPLRPGPCHDLEQLLVETLSIGRQILEVSDDLPVKYNMEWTHRRMKGWYGMAHWDPAAPVATGLLRINRLLDSPDIQAETMRYLLWHEYLHLYLQQAHTKTFRELERKFPGYYDADRELLNLNERFGVQYW